MPRVLFWLLVLLPALAGAVCADEPRADARRVRDLRERLAAATTAAVVEAIGQMVAEPHSQWGELLFEALLRAVRGVERAEQLVPEAEAELRDVRARAAEIKGSSPTKRRRIQEELEEAAAELGRLRDQLQRDLIIQQRLLRAIGQVSRGLDPEARSNLADRFVLRQERLFDLDDRVVLLRAMGQVDSPTVIRALMEVTDRPNEQPDAIVVALASLSQLKAPQAMPAALAVLDHADWRVQSQALEVIQLAHRRSSISFLVERLQTAEGRLRDDLGRVLNSLTGQQFASEPKFWADWWKQNRATFEMPPKPAPAPDPAVARDAEGSAGDGTSFYGIATHSKRVLFVLDVSGSMREPARSYASGRGESRARKIDVARSNLQNAVMGLAEDAVFNVLLYSDECRPVFDEVRPATTENKERALSAVMAREPNGGTNIYAAITRAFAQAERARRATRKDASPRVDTIYFLTDGQASVGPVQNAQLLLTEVELHNFRSRIRIHAVGVGEHDERFMRELARRNGGTYVRP